MAIEIDHQALAESRLATQFRNSDNLKAYIDALLAEANVLEAVFQSLLNDRWIDTAIGVQLDILGEIVGQPRILIDADVLSYFGFDGHLSATSFGTISDPDVGGRFRTLGESTTGNRVLTDDEYRLYIKARAIKNNIIPTTQEMVDFLQFLFEVDLVVIQEGAMHYIVQFGRLLTVNEKALLLNTDLAPDVAGVGTTYAEFDADSYFAFGSFPGAAGFGTLSGPLVGGTFASLI